MARKDYDVIIYMEDELISLDVVVPIEHTGDFIVKFGEEFAVDIMDADKEAKKVDDYYSHPNGWHIRVSVDREQKERLYAFIRNFCKEKNLSFRETYES
jgi:hypothetical protein